jgi:PucR family transcriptional regulator, purine catabolism regulatory protein
MRVREVLDLPCLVGAVVVAGSAELDREIRWVHVIDNPDTVTWARAGQLLLTTGYAWPRDDASLETLLRDLAATGVAAVGLAVPQFFEHFPAAFVRAASAAGMVLIEVPWEIPFAQITEEVHTALLGEQTRIMERSEAIHRALTRAAANATNLESVARTLAAETGHRVFVTAVDGQVLAYGGPAAERPPPEAVAALLAAPRGPCGDAATTMSEVAALGGGGDVAWAVTCAVRVHATEMGAVWLLGRSGVPGSLEARAAEHAALVAALHLAHQRELATVETRLRRSFVDDLLEGRVDASDHASERGHVVGFSTLSPYRVALAELDLQPPLGRDAFARRERALERVRLMLVRRGAADLVTTSSNRVFVLLQEGVAAIDLWHALDDGAAAIVVSRPYHGIEGVRRGFEEVRASIRHVPPGTVAAIDDLLLPRAMSGDTAAQEALVERYVAPLSGVRTGERLVRTLFCLARRDFVLTTTAEALGVHISTLRHRLERIESLLGVDLHDADVRFAVRIAAYVRDLDPLRPT